MYKVKNYYIIRFDLLKCFKIFKYSNLFINKLDLYIY